MNTTYKTFVLKWFVFERFCEIYLERTPFAIERWLIKRAIRPPSSRIPVEKMTAVDRATIDQVFSQLLKTAPQQQHVARICEEIQRQLPFFDLTDDVWSDDCDLVAFCGVLDRKASGTELGNNRAASAMALTSALQIALTGAGRLTSDDSVDPDVLLTLALAPPGGRAQRGFGLAKLAPDPRRFRIGDHVTLTISPPQDASGQFDLYFWETSNPNSAALPDHERRAPWERGAKPILQPLPPLLDETLPRSGALTLTNLLTDSTCRGLHAIGALGVNRTSKTGKVKALAADLRRIVQAYRADNPPAEVGVYDLRTHERIIRELYFFVGRERLTGGTIGSDADVFVGRCVYEIVA